MKKIVMFATLASTLLASCSSEEIVSTKESEAPRKELSFTVGVVTKAGIVEGTAFTDVNTQIGMYVTNKESGQSGYVVAPENFKIAQFEPARTTEGGTVIDNNKPWICKSANKILLSSEVAYVYAFYPYADATKVDKANSDVKISLSSTQSFNPSDKTDYMFAAASRTGNGKEVPYVYSPVEASNATGQNIKSLSFYHTLAKLTFKIKKSALFAASSSTITKIVLSNEVAGHQFTNTSSVDLRMSLLNGTLKNTTAEQQTLTFADTDVSFCTNATTNAAGQVTKGGKDFLIEGLVAPTGLLPTTDSGLNATNAIKVILTVDGVDIPGYIPYVANAAQWKAGENYIYTITVNGTELIVDKAVTVVAWTPQEVLPEINVAN